MRVFHAGRGYITGLSFLDGGRRVLVAEQGPGRGERHGVADVRTGRCKYAKGRCEMAVPMPEGRRVLRWDYERLLMWDVGRGRMEPMRAVPNDTSKTKHMLEGVAPTSDGRVLAVTYCPVPNRTPCRPVSRLRAWELEGDRVLWDVPGVSGERLAWRPGTDQVIHAGATGSHHGVLGVVSPAGRRWRVRFYSAVPTMAVPPDGSMVVVPVARHANVYDADTGVKRFVLAGHAGPVNDVAFSPDGRLIATCDDDEVIFWDARTGRRLRAYRWGLEIHAAVAFSPDGLTCAVGGPGGRVVVWDVEE
jgi:WD40 repeat protein